MSKIDEKTFAPVELVESGDHRGVRLSWDDISYSVTMKKKDEKGVADVVERKTLLHPMSGEALPGEILAIMGPSGAGKSTLLDVLSARLDSTHLKGTISANGTPVNKASFRKMSGYVMQSDALFPLLTVRETFRFAAYLRIAHKTREEKNARAEESIQLLCLEKAADTIIGDDVNRGLSGGEKRRVSIGVDIIHRPSVIFLDEPTSGLDSSTALSVVDSLKQLAETEHCTILMTIHQPSARLFDMLDKVTFLVDGKTAYKGSTEKLSIHIKDIYKEAGLGEVPMVNAPELFLDLCALLSSEGRLNLITDKFACTTSSTLEHSKSQLEEETHIVHASEYANTMAGDTSILMQRALLNVARTPELFVARLGATVFFGVLLGTLFLHTQDTMKGIQQRVSYFLFAMAFYYWTSLEALPIFLAEREIFQREYSRGAYRAVSYTLASTIVTFPFLLILAVVHCCITWWLIGLPNVADTFFFFVFTVFSTIVAGSAFSTMFSVLVPNPMTGQTAGSGIFSAMMLFSGIFISRNDIPDWWIWMHYLSLFKYSFDSMATNVFADVTSSSPPMSNAEIKEFYGIQGVNRGTGVGVLWLFIIFFRLVFYHRLVTAFNGSRKK